MSLYYQSYGQGGPVILLHGLFGASDNWSSIAKNIAKNHQVICVDLRNHGRSPHHPSQSYAEMADDLHTLCDAQGWTNIQLLGHSMGGKVAMQFASRYPNHISKLVVVDMAPRYYAHTHLHLIDAMLAVNVSQMANRRAVDHALAEAIPELMVRQFLLTNLIKVNDHLQWRINLYALKANYHQIQSAVYPSAPITTPACFIIGEHSDYLLPNDQVEISKYYTQSQFVSLPTGHWVHAEQPQRFCQVVSDFLLG